MDLEELDKEAPLIESLPEAARKDLFKGLKHTIQSTQYLEFLTLSEQIKEGLLSLIDISTVSFTVYVKPYEALMKKIKFEELNIETRSKIFSDLKKFYKASLKELIQFIDKMDPSPELKIEALEEYLRNTQYEYRYANGYGYNQGYGGPNNAVN